uniref:Cadherin domain-containing protein n=1 Tax=Magallana gigas TaxID=29159 RepID=A0A8W8I2N0_MAGGI|nr:protocadherin Fat 4 isoform X1 [Crassostrea gigas]
MFLGQRLSFRMSTHFISIIWIFYIDEIIAQEPCTRSAGISDPNIAGVVYESSVLEFDPNSPLYRTDTTIEGINGGTDVNSGVNLTIARTQNTPSSVNLNDLIELVTETVSGSFGRRTYIRLKKEIDRDGTSFTAVDDLDTVEFEISCVSLKSPSETKYFLVQLEIRDINDNPPIFVNAPYTASVDESASVGSTVYSGISATDLDAGSNKEIEFAVVAGDGSFNDGSTRFLLPITSRGEIVVRQPLDFESVRSYTLNISATDKASNPADRRQATTTITISVNDVDDLGPKFVYTGCVEVDNVCFNPTYSTSVTSGSTGGVLVFNPVPANSSNPNVVNIVAEDRDTLNAPINFALQQTLPTGYQNRFQVTTQQVSGSANQYQAIVTQTSPFNRSQVSELELFIEARETLTNRYSNRATIKMTIAAVNNDSDGNSCYINRNSPKFPVPMYIVNIREGNYTKVHQLLLEVSATDGDKNQVSGILFDIQGVSNNGAGKFSLKSNGQTGKISIVCTGNIVGGDHYLIMLRASDRDMTDSSRRSTSVPVEVRVVSLGKNR